MDNGAVQTGSPSIANVTADMVVTVVYKATETDYSSSVAGGDQNSNHSGNPSSAHTVSDVDRYTESGTSSENIPAGPANNTDGNGSFEDAVDNSKTGDPLTVFGLALTNSAAPVWSKRCVCALRSYRRNRQRVWTKCPIGKIHLRNASQTSSLAGMVWKGNTEKGTNAFLGVPSNGLIFVLFG